jgi:hypothetical protein
MRAGIVAFVFLLLVSTSAKAEIVFITDHLSMADEVVYVTTQGRGEPIWSKQPNPRCTCVSCTTEPRFVPPNGG